MPCNIAEQRGRNRAAAEGWNLADLTVILVHLGENVRYFQIQICPPCLLNCGPFFLKEAIPRAKYEAFKAVLPNIRVFWNIREEGIPVSESQQSQYAYLKPLGLFVSHPLAGVTLVSTYATRFNTENYAFLPTL
jgi:hypothetical protein